MDKDRNQSIIPKYLSLKALPSQILNKPGGVHFTGNLCSAKWELD